MAAVSVGELVAVLKLKDELSPGIAHAGRSLGVLSSALKGDLASIGKIAGAAAAGVAATATAIALLADRGAEVADVEQQFNALNESIGNDGKDALATLRQAFDGTVSDFEIMRSVNLALSSGLKLTGTEMGTVAAASRVLADRVGGDGKQAFEALTQAMAFGNERMLRQVGITIDAEAALKAYAASIGKSADELTRAEQIAAKKNAILAALAKTLALTGAAERDFGDRIAIGRVALQNMIDTIGKGIANSPVLAAAMDGISSAILNAFGPNQEQALKTIIGLVNDFAFFGIKTAKVIVATVGAMGLAWNGLKLVFNGVMAVMFDAAEGFVNAIFKMVAVANMLPGIGNRFDGLIQTLLEARNTFNLTGNVFRDQAKDASKAGFEWDKSIKTVIGSLDDIETTMRVAEKTTLSNTQSTKKLAAAAGETTEALAGQAGATMKLSEAQEKAKKTIDEFLSTTFKLPSVFEAAKQQMTSFAAAGQGLVKSVTSIEVAWARMRTTLRQPLGSLVKEIPVLLTGGQNPFKDVFKKSLSEAFKGIPQLIVGAVQGGGSIFKSLGASLGGALGEGLAAKIKGALFGAKGLKDLLGQGLASILPGIGSLLGPAIGGLFGKIGGFFGGLFGGGEGKKVNKLRDDFISAAGGMEELRKKAEEAGVTLDKLLSAKKVKDFDAAVRELQGAFDLNALAQEKLQAAIEKYGFSIEELGPKFAAQKLDEMAASLLEDYHLLIASGIQNNTVISKMAPNIQEYVNAALAAGQAIPESMRPIIEQMIAMGLLTDSSGNKFENLEQTGLQFTQSLSDGLKDAIDAINRLVNALLGVKSPGPIHIPIIYDDPGFPGGRRGPGGRVPRDRDSEGLPGFAFGTAGFRDFGRGTLAMLHGREAVVPQGAAVPSSGQDGASLQSIAASLGTLDKKIVRGFRDALILAGR